MNFSSLLVIAALCLGFSVTVYSLRGRLQPTSRRLPPAHGESGN